MFIEDGIWGPAKKEEGNIWNFLLYVLSSDYALRTYLETHSAPHPGAEKQLIHTGAGSLKISCTRLRHVTGNLHIQHWIFLTCQTFEFCRRSQGHGR